MLNETLDKALYGDDPNALRGAEYNVDLHQKHKVAWTAALLKGIPSNTTPMRSKLDAITWPPLIWAGTAPQWADRFKGTQIEAVRANWQKNGQNQVTGIPEGDKANAVFARRPPEWRL